MTATGAATGRIILLPVAETCRVLVEIGKHALLHIMNIPLRVPRLGKEESFHAWIRQHMPPNQKLSI